MRRATGFRLGAWLVTLLAASARLVAANEPAATAAHSLGRSIYERYCYQCHGYAGDAQTLARSFLKPPPRDFTGTSPQELSRGVMVQAVARGRPGTAMVGFGRVLSAAQIEAVVDYVRDTFLGAPPGPGRYHTAANGWPGHERYASAFPFASGTLALDTPWEALSASQRAGKRLFLTACVSCHDRGRVREEGPSWDLDAVSFPRSGSPFTQPSVDAVSSASPHALHNRPYPLDRVSRRARKGRELFLENCAFCHASDGTGRNWIGSFLHPHPRDLTAPGLIASMGTERLRRTIREGLANSSMPAWGSVLTKAQTDDLVAYLQEAFGGEALAAAANETPQSEAPVLPRWERIAPTPPANP